MDSIDRFVYSTLSVPYVEQIILENYDFESVSDVIFWRRSYNDTYMFNGDNREYVLRVVNSNKYFVNYDENFLFELELLKFLERNEVSISSPIQSETGASQITVPAAEGPRNVFITPKAKGIQLSNLSTEDLSPGIIEEFGGLIGQFHSVTNDFKSKYKRHKLELDHYVYGIRNIVEQFMKTRNIKGFEIIKRVTDYLISRVNFDDLSKNDGFGIIHGDINFSNVFVDLSNPTPELTLYDFDLSGLGWRAFDLYFCREDIESQDLWDNFEEGYSKYRKIPNIEVEAFKSLSKIATFWDNFEYIQMYWRYGESFLRNAIEQMIALCNKWSKELNLT